MVIYSAWLLGPWLNPALSSSQSYVSELSVPDQPHVVFFRLANLLGSLCMTIGFLLLLRRRRASSSSILVLKLLAGISAIGIINAVFPMSCAPSQSHACLVVQEQFDFTIGQWIHLASAVLIFSGLLAAQFYTTLRLFMRYSWKFWLSLTNALIQLVLNTIVVIICLYGWSNVGIFQRLSLILFTLWLVVITLELSAEGNKKPVNQTGS